MIKKIAILLFVLSTIACIDEIRFEPPAELLNTTAILGKIVKGNPSSVEVSIQKVFDFTFVSSSFVNAQSVRVVNQAGNKLEIPRSGTGSYKLILDATFDFEVAYGKSYGIEVDLIDGQSFKSELELLIPVPEMEKVEHKLIDKVFNLDNELVVQPRIEYTVSTQLIEQTTQAPTNLKWDFERTYKQSDINGQECYVNGFANFDLIQTVNANEVNASSLKNHLILEQSISNTIVEGQYLFIIQESLDDDALNFWEQARALSTNSGTFYEPPPGQLTTNIEVTSETEGSVFGYFYSTEHDTINIFVDSTFINEFKPICPRPPSPAPCADCCDCKLVPKSTPIKPSFWID